jgi:hypothetical protein
MPEDDQEKAIANHGFKPVDPMLLKFGATALGKICRVAANLRFAGSERSEVGARPSQQDFCLRDLQRVYWFSIPTSLIIAEPVGGDTLEPTDLHALVMFVADATKPSSSAGRDAIGK